MIDWDDIEVCQGCNNNFDISELDNIDGELYCFECAENLTLYLDNADKETE